MYRTPKWFRFTAAAALALFVTAPLRAQESKIYQQGHGWVEETTGSLPASRSLRVTLRMGSVRVSGGAATGITYTIITRIRASSEADARRELGRIRVTARAGDPAAIATEFDGGHMRNLSVSAEISVPRELASLDVDSGGGSVAVSHLAGRVDAKTGGGSLKLDSIGGPVLAATGGGSIHVADVAQVRLSTGGGSIEVQGNTGAVTASSGGGSVRLASVTQNAKIETGGGGIDAEKCGGEMDARTGGGSISIAEVSGPAVLETGGGSIRLGAARGPVRATTGGGSIQLMKLSTSAFAETGAGSITAQFVAQRGAFAASTLQSGAGDVVVYLPSDLPVTIQAHIEAAMGHSIVSDFPELNVSTEGSSYGPRDVSAQGSLNGGGPTLRIQTSLGSIQIRKLQQ